MPSSPKCRSGVNLPKRWRASSSRAGIPSISHVRCSPLLLGSGDIARQLGDINELAASIDRDGLLQPITITPDGVLVCGVRRLAAIRQRCARS